MTTSLILVCVLTLIIHAAETMGYAIRLAGIRSGKLAVSLSLSGIIMLVSRTSNMVQATFTGGMIDSAKTEGGHRLQTDFQYIIGSASLGTLVSILLFPTMVFIFMRLIAHLEVAGSFPALVRESVSLDKLKRASQNVRLPRWEMLRRLRIGGIPKRLLLLNAAVTGIYTVGVLSALYASYLVPEHAIKASQSSGLINGIATVLLTVFVDPHVALLSDKALSGKVGNAETNKMFGLLMLSRLAGTLLAQLLLLPGAAIIAWWVS